MSKKYLKKSEFRYYNRKEYLDRNGKPHAAYISVRNGHRYKFNVVTHSKSFFDKPTEKMSRNPELNSKYKKKDSRISVPMWDKDTYFSDRLPKTKWRISNEDKRLVRKINRKYK